MDNKQCSIGSDFLIIAFGVSEQRYRKRASYAHQFIVDDKQAIARSHRFSRRIDVIDRLPVRHQRRLIDMTATRRLTTLSESFQMCNVFFRKLGRNSDRFALHGSRLYRRNRPIVAASGARATAYFS